MPQTTYDLKSVKLPRLAGASLRAFVAAIENPLTRSAIIPNLLQSGGITPLRQLALDDPPTFLPLWDTRARDASPLDLTRLIQTPRARQGLCVCDDARVL